MINWIAFKKYINDTIVEALDWADSMPMILAIPVIVFGFIVEFVKEFVPELEGTILLNKMKLTKEKKLMKIFDKCSFSTYDLYNFCKRFEQLKNGEQLSRHEIESLYHDIFGAFDNNLIKEEDLEYIKGFMPHAIEIAKSNTEFLDKRKKMQENIVEVVNNEKYYPIALQKAYIAGSENRLFIKVIMVISENISEFRYDYNLISRVMQRIYDTKFQGCEISDRYILSIISDILKQDFLALDTVQNKVKLLEQRN